MATEIITRSSSISGPSDQFGGGLTGSFLLHAAAVALLAGWVYLAHPGQNWGDANATAGAIPATMVNAIPLPPRQPTDQNNILATETPSPAPVIPAPQTIETPKADAIPIPSKPPKAAKIADKTNPPPPLHPQPTKVAPNQVQAGEAPGVRIAMSSTQTQAGTFSVGATDTTYESRFGYYNEQIKRKLESEWYAALLDPQAQGHRVYINFRVGRDGTPTNIRIAQPSGDATLDQTSLNAVRHVDTFGPLPDAYQGSYVDVTYYFDPPPRP
jgi:protein TonB